MSVYAAIDGSNNGENNKDIAMMKTNSSKVSPPPCTLDSDDPFHDNKLTGFCMPSPSTRCRGTRKSCYCCIGPPVVICMIYVIKIHVIDMTTCNLFFIYIRVN